MLPAAVPIGLTLAGLLGGSAVGQVLDRPRRFVMEDLPELFGYEGTSGGEIAAGLTGDRDSLLTQALGFGIDAAADPLTYLGGGAGGAAGAGLRRVSGQVDDAVAARLAAAQPLARDAAAARKVADLGAGALGTETGRAEGVRSRLIADLERQLGGMPRLTDDVAMAEATVPGGRGLLARLGGTGLAGPGSDLPPEGVLSSGLLAALQGAEGRRFAPRAYTAAAADPDLPMMLRGAGVGTPTGGGGVKLPVPAGEIPDAVQVRGGRLFGGGQMADPLSALDLAAEPTPNPAYSAVQQALWAAQDARPAARAVSTVEALGLGPRDAAFYRLNTPGMLGDAGHLIDQPVGQAAGPMSQAAGQAESALAAALGGPPDGLGPAGRLYYRLFGRQPPPNLGPVAPGNPNFDPLRR